MIYGSWNQRLRRIFLKHDEVQNSPNSPTRKQSSPQQATPPPTSFHRAALPLSGSGEPGGSGSSSERGDAHAPRPPRGRVTTVGCASEPTRRSTNSMKGQNTSVAVPFELNPPYPAAKQKTCLPLPSVNFSSARFLPWLRDGFNCAVKEKQAGITVHPPPLAMASLLLGENGTHRNPPTKNGT